MNTIEQGLCPQLASPQSFPVWWTIVATAQIPSQARDRLPEGSRRHGRGRAACLGNYHCQQIVLRNLMGRTIRLSAREVMQLQQAHRDGREQTDQPHQAVRCVHQPCFNLPVLRHW